MDYAFMKNSVIAMVSTVAGVSALQHFFPAYGKRFSVGIFIIDFGIFSLSAGISFFYSLNEI